MKHSLIFKKTSARLKVLSVLMCSFLLFANNSIVAEPVALKFSRNFLWGVSSAGYQNEGYNKPSNWTHYENQGVKNGEMDSYKNSVDFFHRYKEDIYLAKRIGVKVFRFSVEWSRIEPKENYWDPNGWKFYDNVINTLVSNHIRPMITLDHWVYPEWEYDKGGWDSPSMVNDWVEHSKKIIDRYAKFSPLWVSFNEPLYYVMNEVTHNTIKIQESLLMFSKLVKSHKLIYSYLHRFYGNQKMTSNDAYMNIDGLEKLSNSLFLDKISNYIDFVGFDFYNVLLNTHKIYKPMIDFLSKNLKINFNFDYNDDLVSPTKGIYDASRYFFKKYPKLSQYIVENGTPSNNGEPRTDGLDKGLNLYNTLTWLKKAINYGVNVFGYNYWSITDNYEWGTYSPRFGLYRVDVLNDSKLIRKPTSGVFTYKKIINTH